MTACTCTHMILVRSSLRSKRRCGITEMSFPALSSPPIWAEFDGLFLVRAPGDGAGTHRMTVALAATEILTSLQV